MYSHGQAIGKWNSILYRCGQSYIAQQLKPYNIGSGQHRFLLLLYKKDGIKQDELSKHLNIDKANTARALKKLENEGYVLRKIDVNDKRKYRVYLTEKAKQIRPDIFKVLQKWTDIITADLSDEEKDMAVELLEKISLNAHSFLHSNN